MAPEAPLSARALGRATLARQGLLKSMRSSAAGGVPHPLRRLGSSTADALGGEAARVLALIAPDARERRISFG